MSPNPSRPVFLGGLLFLSLKDMVTPEGISEKLLDSKGFGLFPRIP